MGEQSLVSASVEVDAPAADTWAVVTDWTAQGDWIPLTTVTVDSATSVGLGTRLVARTGLGRLAIVDRMVVDVWQPPHRCEVIHRGPVVTGRGVFLVEEIPGDRSRFTWQEIPDGVGVWGRIERLGTPLSKQALALAARRLARVAERPRR